MTPQCPVSIGVASKNRTENQRIPRSTACARCNHRHDIEGQCRVLSPSLRLMKWLHTRQRGAVSLHGGQDAVQCVTMQSNISVKKEEDFVPCVACSNPTRMWFAQPSCGKFTCLDYSRTCTGCKRRSVVGRIIIDHDDFVSGFRLGENLNNHVFDVSFLVACRNDHRHRNPLVVCWLEPMYSQHQPTGRRRCRQIDEDVGRVHRLSRA